MTYSVGFRAPARSELIAHWCDHLLGILPDDDRYTDPAMTPQANPGEIAPATLDRLHAMITDALSDRQAFAKWFGEYTSTPKYPDAIEAIEDEDEAAIRGRLSEGTPLVRNPASRFVFVRSDAGSIQLFVEGSSYECFGEAAPFAERLCAEERIAFDPSQEITDATIALIAEFLNNGSIAFEG
jgi:50S ribosomal protein L16 3-hydroxylase